MYVYGNYTGTGQTHIHGALLKSIEFQFRIANLMPGNSFKLTPLTALSFQHLPLTQLQPAATKAFRAAKCSAI